jgi:hypothetical protein
MRTFHRFACVLVLIFCATGLTAEDWNTGTLLSFNHHQDTTLHQGTEKNDGITFYLKVDVGDRIYFVNHHIGFIFQHTPQLTENSTIRWRAEKGMFVYLDDTGRKFKAYVDKTRMK